MTQNGIEKEIGYDSFITWTQADTAFQRKFVLTLYVRDDDGVGKDSVTLESYPPPKSRAPSSATMSSAAAVAVRSQICEIRSHPRASPLVNPGFLRAPEGGG